MKAQGVEGEVEARVEHSACLPPEMGLAGVAAARRCWAEQAAQEVLWEVLERHVQTGGRVVEVVLRELDSRVRLHQTRPTMGGEVEVGAVRAQRDSKGSGELGLCDQGPHSRRPSSELELVGRRAPVKSRRATQGARAVRAVRAKTDR